VLKQRIIIILFLSAYTIVFAHNIVPHHHHHDHYIAEQGQEEKNDSQDHSIKDILAVYQHFGTAMSPGFLTKTDEYRSLIQTFFFCARTFFTVEPEESPPQLCFFAEDLIPILPDKSFARALRAPPVRC
jgi:hypothetical protein